MNFRVNLIDNDEPEDIDMRIKRLCESLNLKAKTDLSSGDLYLFANSTLKPIIGRFTTKKSLYSHLEVLAEYQKYRDYLRV